MADFYQQDTVGSYRIATGPTLETITTLTEHAQKENISLKTKNSEPEGHIKKAELIHQIESIIKHVSADQMGSVAVDGIFDKWPELVPQKRPNPAWTGFKYLPYPTGDDVEDEKAIMAAGFKPPSIFDPNRNETIGLVCGVAPDGHSIEYYPIKYRTKLALIEEGCRHATISGGAVILDNDRGELLLHVRSNFPNIVYEAVGETHCFLGSVRVPSSDRRWEADQSLEDGAERECREECGSSVEMKGGEIAIVAWSQNESHGSHELLHSGLDIIYLGAQVRDYHKLKTRKKYQEFGQESALKWEGSVEPIALEEEAIFRKFTTQSLDWFPPGIAHCLLWLGLGAFGAPEEFVEKSGALYARIVDYYASLGAP